MTIYHITNPDFVELTYLESTGTQYIDLGLKGNLNTEIQIKCDITSYNSVVYGMNNPLTKAVTLYVGTTTGQGNQRFGNQSQLKNASDILGSHTFVHNKNGITRDGASWVTYGSQSAFTTERNIYLLACNQGSNPIDYYTSGKIYYFKIYDNNELVRAFYPAKRKSDGALGMLDISHAYTKNMFNNGAILECYYIDSNGTLVPNGTLTSNHWSVSDYIEVKPDTDYSFRSMTWGSAPKVCFYDKNKNFLSSVGQGAKITTPANCAFLRFNVIDSYLKTAQMEEGSTSTAFEPYGGFYENAGTGTFTAGSEIKPVQLRFPMKKVEEYVIPDSYEELSYLESSGTQYIDTGFIPTTKTALDIRFKTPSNLTVFETIFGCQSSGSSKKFMSLIGVNPLFNLQYCTTNTTKTSITGLSPSTDYLLRVEYQKLFLNGQQVASETETVTGYNYSIYLFARNNAGTAGIDNMFKGRVYSCKIWDNSTLIRHFIPARRKSDNVLGMYESVSGTFYTNQGSGVFKAGEVVRHGLPKGYKQVEYLQTSGPQYINTDILMKATHKIECKFQALAITSGANRNYIFGADNNAYGVQYSYSSSTFFGVAGWYQQNDPLTMDLNPHIAEVYDNKVFLDGVSQKLDKGGGTGPYSSKLPIHIFGYNYGNHTAPTVPDRIYYYKMWDNNELIMDLVPVVKLSTNEAMMYDMVSGQEFTNKGSGTFTAGPISEEPTTKLVNKVMFVRSGGYPSYLNDYVPLEYIQSSGTQYIDTGMIPNQTTKAKCSFIYTKDASGTTSYSVLFGSRVVHKQRQFNAWIYSDNPQDGIRVDYANGFNIYGNKMNQIPEGTLEVGKRYNYELGHAYFKCPELQIDYQFPDDSTYQSNFECPYSLSLFCLNNNGTNNWFAYVKMYSMSIEHEGKLVRDFIPVKEKSGSQRVGLLDIVNNVFYPNAGSGSFTAGPELPVSKPTLRFIRF